MCFSSPSSFAFPIRNLASASASAAAAAVFLINCVLRPSQITGVNSSKFRAPAIKINLACQQSTRPRTHGALTTSDLRDAVLRAQISLNWAIFKGSHSASLIMSLCDCRHRLNRSSTSLSSCALISGSHMLSLTRVL